jgi:Protein of unknown function (DUF3014)
VSPASRIVIGLLAVGALVGAFFWGQRQKPIPPAPAPAPVVVPAAPDVPPPAPPEPAIRYPVDSAGSPSHSPLPSLDNSDDYFGKALTDLLGRKNLTSFLALDGIARRLVATVNNLATDSATAELWPVNRTAGRFEAEAGAVGSVISDKNPDRYAPFVRFVDEVDSARAVALYLRVYPLLQRAYEDLGFPGHYFNDRVVEVIDHLLATPDVVHPIKVKRVVLEGAPRPPTAGGLYLFEDPALEARSSGQKILLRMGADNARKLKAKLTDLRQRIVRAPVRQPR